MTKKEETIGETIRRLRESRNISQKDLAKAAGVSQPTIADLESGKHQTSRKLPAIAKALGVTVGYIDKNFIAEWNGEKSSDLVSLGDAVPVRSARVIGVVQAGVWTEFEEFEDDGISDEEIPYVSGTYGHLPQYAFKVKGNSMDLDRIFDGDYVVSVSYFDARPDIKDGDRVIVERQRNSAVERTVKIIEIHGKDIHFCPKSSDPRFKPIIVKISRQLKEPDDTEVRIVGLVIWRGGRV